MLKSTGSTKQASNGTFPLDSSSPAWIRDVSRFFSVRSQFIISGNINDLVLIPSANQSIPISLHEAIWSLLEVSGFDYVLAYDPFDDFKIIDSNDEKKKVIKSIANLTFDGVGRASGSSQKLIEVMRAVSVNRDHRGAIIVEHAARLGDDDARNVFGAALKLSRSAVQIPSRDGRAVYAPIFWIVDEINDLPTWLTAKNERIRHQIIPKPDLETRLKASQVLVQMLNGYQDESATGQKRSATELARATEGFTVDGLMSTVQLARDQGYPPSRIQDAVRLYKLGVTDNPWEREALRELIEGAAASIAAQVKGQDQAIHHVVDALIRSVQGLGSSSGPKAVLFFAGPTGVGKTELAKAITSLLFGDEKAYIRFDMSEFTQEHTEARLIGAPPGYVGHESGGELTNAIREKPFSVVLFDEIEKAHPRIFDKFLQILQDGRLTDSRGDTAFFTESILIFTSNLGIVAEDKFGTRTQVVHPGMDYQELDERIRLEIERYFAERLGRPEIYGRLRDNIIVFNFITESAAEQILDKMINNIIERFNSKLGIQVSVSSTAYEFIKRNCLSDLSSGGRGIGSKLEVVFLNPLARALFSSKRTPGGTITVSSISDVDSVFEATLA